MGDRCYLSLWLRGHIPSLKALVAISKAISDEGLTDEVQGGKGWKNVMASIADCAANPDFGAPRFVDYECNYANIDDVEKVLQKYEVAYEVSHQAGDDYSAGCWAYFPGKGKFEASTDGDEAVLTVSTIRHAMDCGNLEELLEYAEMADGKGLPLDFTVSEKLKVTVAKIMAQKALNI